MSERRRGISTRAIHSPPPRTGPGEPLVGPIVASTTFSFEHVADLGRVIAEEEYGFTYARLRNPTVEELNAVVAELESAEAAESLTKEIESLGVRAIASQCDVASTENAASSDM